MGHILRSRGPVRRAEPSSRRQLLTMLCLLVSVLSLTLGACSGPVLPSGLLHAPTPTPALPSACTPTEAAWSAPGYELPTTRPLVVDGVVYVGYALKAPPNDPLGDINNNQRNYVDRFAIAALRARDGATLWRVPTTRGTWPYTVTGAWPLAVADGVLVAYDTGLDANGLVGLVGLRARDGATLWRTPLDFRTMTARGGGLYVTTNDGVSALRIVDGRLLWRTPVRGAPLSAPLLVGASLYLATTYGRVVALRADTGAVRWSDVLSPFGQYLPLEVSAGWLYVYAPSDAPQGIAAGVLRLNPASGARQGYVLRLPPSIVALFPSLQAGVFYAIVFPFGVTTPQPPNAIAAYRLSATGSQLLWRTPIQRSLDTSDVVAAYDAQTFYLTDSELGDHAWTWTISAFRLSDGALLWQQRALAMGRTAVTVGAGELVETTYGLVSPCLTPPIDRAPQIRTYASVDGRVTWTRVLDATL